MLWFDILCEIAYHVSNNVKKYRHLFSSKKEKIVISVPTDDETSIDVSLLISALQKLVPMDVDTFFPTLTTHNSISHMCHQAAFCDVVSSYYSYFTYACGIPKVTVMGTKEDYDAISLALVVLSKKLDGLSSYLLRMKDLSDSIWNGDKEFWKDIFHSKQCGSGGQTDINGWYTEVCPIKKGAPQRIVNTQHSHIAKVNYESLETGNKYIMLCGIFGGTLSDGNLIPSYGKMIVRDLSN